MTFFILSSFFVFFLFCYSVLFFSWPLPLHHQIVNKHTKWYNTYIIKKGSENKVTNCKKKLSKMTDDANGLLPRTGIVPTAGKMILPSACRNRAEIPPHESWPESWGGCFGCYRKKFTGKKFMVLCTQSTMKFRDGWNHANWGFWSFWVGPPHCIHPKPTVIVKAGMVSGSRLKLLPMTLLGIRKWNSFCSGRRQSGNAL